MGNAPAEPPRPDWETVESLRASVESEMCGPVEMPAGEAWCRWAKAKIEAITTERGSVTRKSQSWRDKFLAQVAVTDTVEAQLDEERGFSLELRKERDEARAHSDSHRSARKQVKKERDKARAEAADWRRLCDKARTEVDAEKARYQNTMERIAKAADIVDPIQLMALAENNDQTYLDVLVQHISTLGGPLGDRT